MKWLGYPADRWSLARVYAAMLVGGAVGGALGYVVDLVIGSLLDQGGWWTVFAFGGAIVGTTAQAVREFGPPTTDDGRPTENRRPTTDEGT